MLLAKRNFALLLFAVSLSIAARLFFLHPTYSDESFYFNIAKSIAEGKIPYSDFFFAHPPLQVYSLAALYKIFGSSFITGKLLTLISSSFSLLLLYLIVKEVYRENSALFAAILFLLSPPFLAFSTTSYGMWEAMVFLLLSLLLALKKRAFPSAAFFVAAVFFRYIAIFYLPLLLMLLHLRNEKIFRFLLPSVLLISFGLLLPFQLFGTNYITQTIFYHLSKPSLPTQIQYLGMGMFFIFLALISALIGFLEKDKFVLVFALFPPAVDALLLLAFKMTFYHYFLLSAPIYLIGASKIFETGYTFAKSAVAALLIISIAFNLKTLDFYLNPAHSEKFYHVANFVRANTLESDVLFGEPVVTNYISFVTGRKIAGNYFDSYLQHLSFEGIGKVVGILEKERPRLILEVESYYLTVPELRRLILENYVLVSEVGRMPRFLIYQLKG